MKNKFVPTKENCKVKIKVDHQTEKAYAVWAGDNGKITNPKSFYEYIAKSICYVENGNVYAPIWATRLIPYSEKEYVDGISEK